MRLRRIVLSGFKTFARRSEVIFQPGITAVVGPNGSGKSNLVDALRWALGETNARELRGARMDEVIYSGGQGRARMGVAEVELVLDNTDGRLPAEDSEVAITRRVVRGGDSEYRINGDRRRRRDVERLLDVTGLTQSGYAVVAQNDIDAVIEASPLQRRSLVEQAAGVRPLRNACEDALHRIGSVEQAVLRLADRLEESEPRLTELAVEAEAALEQRVLADRLAELRGSLAREEWRAARAQLRQARRRLDAAQRRLEAAAEAEAAFAERLQGERDRLDTTRDEQRRAAEALEAARLAAERAAGEVRRWSDRRSAGVLQRAAARTELGHALEELAAAEAALAELAGSDAGAREAGGRLEIDVAELRAAVDAHAAELVEAEAEASEADDAVTAAVEALAAAQAAARHLTAQLSLFDDAVSALESEIGGVRERLAELETAAEAAAGLRASRAEAMAAADADLRSARSAVEQARASLREAEAGLAERSAAAREALARAASLRGRLEGALGGEGVISGRAGELGAVRLVEAVHVRDAADAAAIEAALEGHLASWVVDDVDAVAALLARSDVREEVLLAGPAGPVPFAPPGARIALSAVDVRDPRCGAAADHCLAATWLVPDLPAARSAVAAAGGRAIVPDGSVVTAAGIRAGGRAGATLELVAEEREARLRAEEAVADEAEAGEVVRDRAAAVAAADDAVQRAADTLAATRRELSEADAAHAAARAAAVAERQRLATLENDLRRRHEEGAAAAEAAGDARSKLESATAGEEAARRHAVAARSVLAQRRERHRGLQDRLAEAERGLAEMRRIADDAARRLREAEQRRQASSQRAHHAESRLAAAEMETIGAILRARAAAVAVGTAGEAVVEAETRLAGLALPVAELERVVLTLDAERAEVAVALARAQDEVAAAEAETAVAEGHVGKLAEAMRDEAEEDVDELDPAAVEKAEREIVRLERRIAAMGPVNGLAPEQLAILEERVGSLRRDHDDLDAAADDIRALAERLGDEANHRFEAVFDAVRVHFGELFEELFPGGRATLRLEETPPAVDGEEDLEDRRERRQGVEILAQPAGKRLQHLSLLSGGERALTALAVILALQAVTPSPFYVFDEVDAPLDDTNVLRFTRLLSRLAQEQQFIVVTHNHVTMAAASALYGVTIDKEGVSSVLSVRFTEDDVPEGDVVGLRQTAVRSVAS